MDKFEAIEEFQDRIVISLDRCDLKVKVNGKNISLRNAFREYVVNNAKYREFVGRMSFIEKIKYKLNNGRYSNQNFLNRMRSAETIVNACRETFPDDFENGRDIALWIGRTGLSVNRVTINEDEKEERCLKKFVSQEYAGYRKYLDDRRKKAEKNPSKAPLLG